MGAGRGSCLFRDTAGIWGGVNIAVKQVLDTEQTISTLFHQSLQRRFVSASFSSEVDLHGVLGILGTLQHLG